MVLGLMMSSLTWSCDGGGDEVLVDLLLLKVIYDIKMASLVENFSCLP